MEHPSVGGLGPTILGITWLFTSLAIITVALRLYARRNVSTGTRNWDDWTMLLAVVVQLVGQVTLTKACLWGFGKPYPDLTPKEFAETENWEFISVPFSLFTELIARLSIAILLTRIFGLTRPWFKWLLIGYTVITWALGLVSIVLTIYQKEALIESFAQRITTVSTYESLAFQLLLDVYDLVFVVLPVAFIWKLNMTLRRKLLLMLLISISLFTVAVQSAKIGLSIIGITGGLTFQQQGIASAVFYIITFVEQSVVIIMGCVPALGPIVNMKIPFFSSISDSLNRLLSKLTGSRRGSADSLPVYDVNMRPKNHISDDGPLL